MVTWDILQSKEEVGKNCWSIKPFPLQKKGARVVGFLVPNCQHFLGSWMSILQPWRTFGCALRARSAIWDALEMAWGWECLMEAGMGWIAPSGYVKIAIENGHRNSGFTYWKWWFSIVMEQFTRGYCSGRTGPSWGQGAASECCRRSLGEAGGTHIGGWGNRWGAAGKRSGAKRREWGMIIHEY